MNINPKILDKIQENNNILTISDVLNLGFSKQTIQNYINAGLLLRVRHGVYILPDSIHDDMYTLMLRSQNIIFSHISALFLNGLSDRTPFLHTVTLPSNKSLPKSIKNECECFYIKPDLHKIGLIYLPTTFGNNVKCYDIERTICDFLRTRERCDEETVISAIKNYANYKDKNLNRLANYANIFKVSNVIKKYMEVLL